MNTPHKIDEAAPVEAFEIEARQLADDDHHVLSREYEWISSDSLRSPQHIAEWEEENGWEDTPAHFFAANRDYYLERAREEFAVQVTA